MHWPSHLGPHTVTPPHWPSRPHMYCAPSSTQLTPSHLHTGHLTLTCTAHPPPHIHWPYALSPVSASCEDYRCRDSLLQLHGSLSQHTSRECVQRCYVACKCVCVDRKSAHDGRLTAVIQWGETIKQPLSLAALTSRSRDPSTNLP